MQSILLFGFLASQSALAAATACAYKPVTLPGYGTFSGTKVNASLTGLALPESVDAWLGMDYSVQPVGERRFTPADWPAAFDGLKVADAYGKACIQGPPPLGVVEENQSEACLSFNVFRPAGVPMSQKLPVLIWFHGGAMCFGHARNFDGPAFVARSEEPVMVVTMQYRVSSLGFLPSTLFDEEGLSNLGIRDQRFFLEFAQKYLGSFGGDADAVTIGGRSAGGHSTGIHYFHNYGKDEGKSLFARAIHQSGSVTSRAFPSVTYPLYQRQFQQYMSYLGCESDDNAEALECLRKADISDIRNISDSMFHEYTHNLTWPFQPVQGGPLFEKPGSQSGIDGTFFHVPTISSTTTNEANYILPGDVETNEEFLEYLHNISPALNAADLDLLDSLYPAPDVEGSPYVDSPNSTQFTRLSDAWSDYAYICPGQETSYRAGLAGVPVWKVRYNTNNRYPSWRGIPHGADTQATWADPGIQYPEIARMYHAYLASFVVSGDPNTHRVEGSPEWPMYEPEAEDECSDDEAQPAKQLVVQPGDTKVEDDVIRKDACLFWRDPERAGRLNK